MAYYLFLATIYGLICAGYVVAFLIENDDIPNAVKVLMAIFSSIVAPLLFGAAFGMIMLDKVKKGTNRG
jgi:fructose-specific phosphotransferase system IIC component